MRKTKSSSVVIYYSEEDGCWIAHSLDTDQIGTGKRVAEALADLIRATRLLYEAARKDPQIRLFRPAPPEIVKLARKATKLPYEVYEVAYRMVHNEWPKNVAIEVCPDELKPPLFATEVELVPA